MPTYDYECQDCGHRFELFQSITAPIKRKCPECGERALERLIGTGAAVLFKGNGFYVTDYRNKSYHEAAKADGSDGGDAKAGDQPAGKERGGGNTAAAGATRSPGGKPKGKKSAKPES